ncbi:hypothetical protein Baya_9289 [Bagarius yarrelli]|uniref:Uncharacterized protein n=1 Tax=Bagarius yarrelli TaxID=175774 RepID=A0A556U6I7_BAGYA|nr:hypothetical protein Baya_9289 [Bagarius yarrelli]
MSGCGWDRTVCRYSNHQRRVIAQGEVKEFLLGVFSKLFKADGIDKKTKMMRIGTGSGSMLAIRPVSYP